MQAREMAQIDLLAAMKLRASKRGRRIWSHESCPATFSSHGEIPPIVGVTAMPTRSNFHSPRGQIHSVGLFNVRELFEVFFKPLPDEVKIFVVDIFGVS